LKTEITKKFISHPKVTLASLAFLSLLAVAPVAYALSSSHISAQGSWTLTKTIVGSNAGPEKTTIVATITKTLSGTLIGTLNAVEIILKYPDGSCTFEYTGVFTGTIDTSATGTAVASATGTCVTGDLQADISFSDGTGGLTGIQGSVESTSTAIGFATGNYVGNLQP
jgi:hypothetical protein